MNVDKTGAPDSLIQEKVR